MSNMVISGVIVTLLGLGGLTYCMLQAYAAKKSGLQGDQLAEHLRRLVAINLASFFIAAIGLAIVVVGFLLAV